MKLILFHSTLSYSIAFHDVHSEEAVGVTAAATNYQCLLSTIEMSNTSGVDH